MTIHAMYKHKAKMVLSLTCVHLEKLPEHWLLLGLCTCIQQPECLSIKDTYFSYMMAHFVEKERGCLQLGAKCLQCSDVLQ